MKRDPNEQIGMLLKKPREGRSQEGLIIQSGNRALGAGPNAEETKDYIMAPGS